MNRSTPPINIRSNPIGIPKKDKQLTIPQIINNRPVAFLIGLQHIDSIRATTPITIAICGIVTTANILSIFIFF